MEVIIAILTAVLVGITYQTWRVYKKIAWFTGAMTTHSLTMQRLEARSLGIKTVWWDPDLEDAPIKRSHGEEAVIEAIYISLPQRERVSWTKASKWKRFRMRLNAEI